MVSEIRIMQDIQATIFSVVEAILPLTVFFIVFQLFFLKLPLRYAMNILKGTLLASCGLVLFLQGVSIGFLPFGRAVGEAFGFLPYKWLLVPLGFSLGFLTTWAEPAVRILAGQLEDASSGAIQHRSVLYAICLGVAFFVALGMLRIVYNIPLIYIMTPGYACVIAMIAFSDKDFLSVAVDAGGVATGPLSNTFLLALALGISSSMGGQDPVVHGLGLVAMIALAPILSVMVLGFIVRWKSRKE